DSIESGQTTSAGVFGLVLVFLLLTALVVALQQGVRKLKVLGARRTGRQAAVPDDYLYLPVNPSGVMSIIFASSLLMFPSTVMQFASRQTGGDPVKGLHDLIANAPVIGPGFTSFSSIPWVANVGSFAVQEFFNCLSYQHWEHSLIYFGLIMFFAF